MTIPESVKPAEVFTNQHTQSRREIQHYRHSTTDHDSPSDSTTTAPDSSVLKNFTPLSVNRSNTSRDGSRNLFLAPTETTAIDGLTRSRNSGVELVMLP